MGPEEVTSVLPRPCPGSAGAGVVSLDLPGAAQSGWSGRVPAVVQQGVASQAEGSPPAPAQQLPKVEVDPGLWL